MTIREYYLKLKAKERPPHPAKQFVLTIAAATGKSPKTIRQWLSGVQVPAKESMLIISSETGIPMEELFPPEEAVV